MTKKLGSNTKAKNFARLLDLTWGQTEPCWQLGNVNWYEGKPIKVSENPINDENSTDEKRMPTPLTLIPHSISPSRMHEKKEQVQGDRIGASDAIEGNKPEEAVSVYFSTGAAVLGIEVHAALASIEWSDSPQLELAPLSIEAQKMLKAFLDLETTRNMFKRPEVSCLLWRERSFDLLLDGQWVSGVFDRVHVLLDANGLPVAAQIYDFKTDDASPEDVARRHADQLAIYRKAVALLLKLKETVVMAEAVPVRNGRRS
ncbi:MAG: hypothetical protein ABI254_13510 [Chthoniobacterales bacterium]